MLGASITLIILATVIPIATSEDDIMDMIQEEGYPSEKHLIETDDNYILAMHRIPPRKPNAIAVLALHGIGGSAAEFLYFGPQYSLAYLMSDAGYDVWLGNVRGTKYSKLHKYFNANTSSAFWEFTIHEIGKYDIPAMIDHILKETNRTALHVVGHSQGCEVLLAMLALRPSYNKKIVLLHALAPSIFIPNSILGLLTPFLRLEPYVRSLGIYEFTIRRPELKWFYEPFQALCGEKSAVQIPCFETVFSAIGTKPPPLTKKSATHIINNTPASMSLKQVIHYGQMVLSGDFHEYDYKSGNMAKYGQRTPPKYNLTNVRTKIQLFYGTGDTVVTPQDMQKFIEVFNPLIVDTVLVQTANHVDFVMAEKARLWFYEKIIILIDSYSRI